MAASVGSRQTQSMNHTPPPSGAQQNTPFGAGFFTWIRGLGIGRGTDRWFAGVAGGIALRAGIDPIIVRGIFIVLALLGGPGIVLYLVGWLLLPDQGGRIHLEEVFRGRAGAAAIVATVAAGIFVVFPMLFRVFGIGVYGGWSLWNVMGMPHWLSTTISVFAWIAVIAGIAVLLSRVFLERGRRVNTETAGAATTQAAPFSAPAEPTAGATPAPPYQASQFAASPTSGAWHPAPSNTADAPAAADTAPPTTSAPGDGTQPPHEQQADWATRVAASADRAGEKAVRWSEDVGKQADEWSARYAQQHDFTRLGAAHVVITLAFALLAAGTAAFIAFDRQVGSDLVLTAALLGATGVLAVSLIIAGVRGRKTGWVGLLAICGVIALLFTSVLPAGTRFQPFGSMNVSTTAPSSVIIAGSSELDLTALDGSGTTEDLDLWHLTGVSVITLPKTEPVILTVRMLAGAIDASEAKPDGERSAGPLLSRTIDTRVDASEPATRVNVYMIAGSIRVEGTATGATRAQLPQAPGTTPELRAELRDELSALRAEEESLITELEGSELSAAHEARLENTLEFTRDEIAKLEKELVR